MRYIPTDKYTVAWFKLAECVAKGEKEKAFGVYRLLMHSLEDKAYAHQLEGDLLGAFQDERALEKYEHAAQLYVSNNRWKEAIALYEELAIISSDNARAVHCLIELYTKHKNPDRCAGKIINLSHSLASKKRLVHAQQLIEALPRGKIALEEAQSCAVWCLSEIKKSELEPGTLEQLLLKTVSYLMDQEDALVLQQFLSELEQVNSHWYRVAQLHLNR